MRVCDSYGSLRQQHQCSPVRASVFVRPSTSGHLLVPLTTGHLLVSLRVISLSWLVHMIIGCTVCRLTLGHCAGVASSTPNSTPVRLPFNETVVPLASRPALQV